MFDTEVRKTLKAKLLAAGDDWAIEVTDAEKDFIDRGLMTGEFQKLMTEVKQIKAFKQSLRDFGKKKPLVNDNDMTFEDAVQPLMRYLAARHRPHTTVIVTSTDAELVEGIKSIRTTEYLKD